jgi:O-antigen/teichoic acid export membrane protein
MTANAPDAPPRLRSLATDLFWYGGGNFLQKISGFLLLPLFTRYLLPADYGLLELANVLLAFLGGAALLGLNEAMARHHVDFEGDRRRRLLGGAMIATGTVSLFLMGGLFVRLDATAHFIFGEESGRPGLALLLIGLRLPLHVAGTVALTALRMERRRAACLLLTLLAAILDIGLSITFVAGYGLGPHGFLAANLAAAALQVAGGLVLLRRELLPALPEHGVLHYGIYLMPAYLVTLLLWQADRLFLTLWTDFGALGLYAVAAKFAGIVWLIQASLAMAWSPLLFRWANTKDYYRIRTAATLGIHLLFVTAVLITMASTFLLPLMTLPAFHAAISLVPGLALAGACYGAAVLGRSGLLVTGRTSLILGIEIVCLGAHLVLSFLLIRAHGAFGASIATAAVFFLSALLSHFWSGRCLPDVTPVQAEHAGHLCFAITIISVALAAESIFSRILLVAGYILLTALYLRRHPLLCQTQAH